MKNTGCNRAGLVQRSLQTLSLGLFLWLLWETAGPLSGPLLSFLPPDAFLRLDPLTALAAPLAAKTVILALLPGLAVIVLAFLAGRIFCGYVCPMGATLDLVRFFLEKLLGRQRRASERTQPAPQQSRERDPLLKGAREEAKQSPPLMGPYRVKYLLLVGILAAALVGVNTLFWASPIPLITRFYALLLHPLLTLGGGESLSLARPLLDLADMPSLSYLAISVRRYDSLYFLLLFFGVLFALERVKPRFWCRFLCPAGAILALASCKPFWRRKVHTCTGCGRCARQCPTGAIAPLGLPSSHRECITCRSCTDVCPVQGVRFTVAPESGLPNTARPKAKTEKIAKEATGKGPEKSAGNSTENGPEKSAKEQGPAPAPARLWPLPDRRTFLIAAGGGAVLAATQLSGARSLLLADGGRGILWPSECIRPPGALPEPAFLDHCVRCGLCMKVCPSNGLQPAWFQAGAEGMFSPVLVSRRGPCEPDCNACGQVCPTGAVVPLPLEEKQWAKIGTARVLHGRCVAWSEGKRCMVCQEVCPYGAIDLIQGPGERAPSPVVRPERCFGCGYCEQHCPVLVPAILVEPVNALRLALPSYRQTGRDIGLELVPGHREHMPADTFQELPEGALPPGFSP